MTTQQSPLPALDALVRGMCEAAVRAGALIMRFYESELDVRQKSDASPVTLADEEASRFILAALGQLAPDIPAVCEEAADAGKAPAVDRRFFLVDPLDGTKEFISKNGEFTVNIGLVEDGQPVAGVVYAPARQRLFFGWRAENGAGYAFEQLVDPHEGTESLQTRTPRAISARRPAPGGLVVVASRSHRDQKTDEYLEKLPVASFVAAGSSLKFCLVASGEADLYPRLGRTMEWDTAAGHAVLNAAGGKVTRLDGAPLTYGKPGFENPFFVSWGAGDRAA